jgi:hypothetical protein
VGQVFAAEHPEKTIALGLAGGPHLGNFFPTTEAVKSVLGSSQRTSRNLLPALVRLALQAPQIRRCHRQAAVVKEARHLLN